VLGEESDIYSYKHDSEVDFCSRAVQGIAGEEGESVDEPAHDGEDSPHRQDVVEVGYDIVCVV